MQLVPYPHFTSTDGLSVSNALKRNNEKNRIGNLIYYGLIKEKSFITNTCINCLNLRKKIY